jgi:hypothetical protein
MASANKMSFQTEAVPITSSVRNDRYRRDPIPSPVPAFPCQVPAVGSLRSHSKPLSKSLRRGSYTLVYTITFSRNPTLPTCSQRLPSKTEECTFEIYTFIYTITPAASRDRRRQYSKSNADSDRANDKSTICVDLRAVHDNFCP